MEQDHAADPEAPEADALEQSREVVPTEHPERPELPTRDPEAPEADALEQARSVPYDDDEDDL